METIKLEVTQDQIQKAVQDLLVEALKSSYNNPVKKAIETALSSQQNAIDTLVSEVITNSLSDPKFKEELGKVVLQQMVSGVISKR